MDNEMRQQPEVLRRLGTRLPIVVDQLRDVASPGIPGVAFLARGSSDNAALFARYAVGLRAALPTVLMAPSLTNLLGARLTGFKGWLAVAFSQSGATPEIVEAARCLRSAGAPVVAVTNTEQSPLALTADLTISLAAGPELAVPATKTVTAQMLTGIALASAFGAEALDSERVAAIPDAVAAMLDDETPIQHLATQLAAFRRLAVVGRGFAYPAALETALKLQETTGVMAHGFATSDFRHGPMRVAGPDTPIVALAGSLPSDTDTVALRNTAQERDAPFHLLGTAPGSTAGWTALGTMAEGILATVRGQQLALLLARELGLDPDQPAGLHKITMTH